MTSTINQYNPETVFHPTKTLVEKLNEIGMGNKEFSIRIGKPEKTITELTQGKCSITPEMAVKFEDVLRIPASFWLNKQRRYDEFLARLKRQKEIQESITWAKRFPFPKWHLLGGFLKQ